MSKSKGNCHVMSLKNHKANNHFNSAYPSDWSFIRHIVLQRDHKTCQFCGKKGGELHVHHLIPISEGGGHNLTNLACACPKCHSILHPLNSELSYLYEIYLIERYNFEQYLGYFLGESVDVFTLVEEESPVLDEGFHYVEDNIITKI